MSAMIQKGSRMSNSSVREKGMRLVICAKSTRPTALMFRLNQSAKDAFCVKRIYKTALIAVKM